MDDLERLVTLHDASMIAAVIIERPQARPAFCCPQGRLGAPFGATYFGVTPDLMSVAKGLTNRCVPMGAVFAKRAIHDVFMTEPEHLIEFPHGCMYSAHPLACAAGLAMLQTYADEGLLTRATAMAP